MCKLNCVNVLKRLNVKLGGSHKGQLSGLFVVNLEISL